MTAADYVVAQAAWKMELLSLAEVAAEPSVQVALQIAAGGYPPWDVAALLPRPTFDFRTVARDYLGDAFCPLDRIPCWYTRVAVEEWVWTVMGRGAKRP